jgi:hypothetical protein
MFSPISVQVLAAATTLHAVGAAELDRLMLFGFLAACVTLGCLPLVRQGVTVRLVLACSLGAQTAYAFMSGAWPMGLVAIVAAGIAAQSWWTRRGLMTLNPDFAQRPRNGRYGLSVPRIQTASRLAGRRWNHEHRADEN